MLNLMHRHRERRSGADDHRGFTLIEVVVAFLLLGIIIVPLTAAFIQGLRRTGEVDRRLARSADLQRITSFWNKDVNSVDRAGVNPADNVCLAVPEFDEENNIIPTVITELVTFQWDTQLPGVEPKTATWAIQGAGADAKLVRRYCEAGAPVNEGVMADSFGVDGLDVNQMVWGRTAGSFNFCNTTTCTINVGGAYSYTVTAERRVPGDEVTDAQPPAPEIVDCQAGPGEVIVVWNPSILTSTQSPVIEYQASLFGDAAGTGVPITSVYVDGNSTSASIPAVTNIGDETFWVRVKARNAQGYGLFGASCGPVNPDPSPPGRPTNPIASPADQTASLDWSGPAAGGSPITSYTIFLQDLVEGTETQYTTSSKPFQLPGGSLVNARPYRFAVQATNLLGTGQKSVYSPDFYPFGPTLPQAQPSQSFLADGTVVVAWYVILPPSAPICLTPPADQNDADIAKAQCISNGSAPSEYRVDIFATDGGGNLVPIPGYPKLIPQPNLPANPPVGLRMSDDIVGLPGGLAYTVLITPINAAGDGASAFVEFLTPPGAVGLPDISATGTGGELQFVLRPPADGSIPGRYEISGPDGRSAEVPAQLGDTPFTWNAGTASGPALQDFERYLFTIRACSLANLCGPWSPTYRGMPIPTPELADVSVAYPASGTAAISFRYATGKGWAPADDVPQRFTRYEARCNGTGTGLVFFPSPAIQTVNFPGLPLGPANCDLTLYTRGEATFGGFATSMELQTGRVPVDVVMVEPPGPIGAPSIYANGASGQLRFEIPEPTVTNGGPVLSYLITGPGGRSASAPANGATTSFTWTAGTASGPALADFTPYAFTIQACNSAGCGTPSPSYTAMPIPTPQIAGFQTSVPATGTARLEFAYAPGTGWSPADASPLRSTDYLANCGGPATELTFVSAAPVQVDFGGLPVAPVTCSVTLRSVGVATWGGTAGSQLVSSSPTTTTFLVARPPGVIGTGVTIRATGALNQPPVGASSVLRFIIPDPSDSGDLGVNTYEIRGSGGRSATVARTGASTQWDWTPSSASGPRLVDFTGSEFEIRACSTDAGCGPWSPPYLAVSAPTPLMQTISATSPAPGVARLTFQVSPGRGAVPPVETPKAVTSWRIRCGSFDSGLVELTQTGSITFDATGLPAGSVTCTIASRTDVAATVGGFLNQHALGQSPATVNFAPVVVQ